MNHFKVLEFLNPNKQRPVSVVAGMIVGFDYNKPTECNVLYTAGGHIFPVAESLDEIKEKIESLNVPSGQGEKNVSTKQTV